MWVPDVNMVAPAPTPCSDLLLSVKICIVLLSSWHSLRIVNKNAGCSQCLVCVHVCARMRAYVRACVVFSLLTFLLWHVNFSYGKVLSYTSFKKFRCPGHKLHTGTR